VENSPFVLLESRLLRLLPGVDWWLPGWLTQGCCPAVPGPLLFPGKRSPAERGRSGSGGGSCTGKPDRGCAPSPEKLAWLTVVDPKSNRCSFNRGGSGQGNNKRPLQWGSNGWTFYSFTQTMFFVFFLTE
jgi:hypothetical protein